MIRFTLTALLLLLSIAQSFSMKISGNISVIRPEVITIKGADRKEIVKIEINKSGAIDAIELSIAPDIYIFGIGDSEEFIYLDGSDLTIDGFLDSKNPDKSELNITGIDTNSKFQLLANNYVNSNNGTALISDYIASGKLPGNMISAVAYMKPLKKYEDAKLIYDYVPADYKSITKDILKRQVDSLARYRIGEPAPEFTVVDQTGKSVSLSDFRGKYVVLDFWASWCGPCKLEIRKMKKFYPKYGNKDVVFISLSMDETKEEWLNALKIEEIPWITLWGEGGFKHSPFKADFGFRSIPFVVLIDKEGNVVARGIRGNKIEEELEKRL